MARKSLSNWSIEDCSTVGTGPLILTGAINIAQSRFRDGLSAGAIWYTIVDGSNREAGYGTFNGTNTVTRDEVHSTIVNGVFNDNSPPPITLAGTGVVSGTFNAEAYQEIVDEFERINTSVDAIEVDILALQIVAPTSDQKAAMDAATNPNGSNRFTVDSELSVVVNALQSHLDTAADAHDATAISVVVTGFDKNLGAGDVDVQKALQTVNDLDLGAGGTPPNAIDVPTDTTSFNNNLSAADTDVQKALDTLDDLSLGGGTSIHNDLTGIQGGAVDDYFHLLQADVTKLAGIEAGAKDDQTAVDVPTDTTSFNNNLSAADTDVQKALDTLDDLSLGGGTSIHNDLTGIQGGAVDDYFHLLQADVTKLTGIEAGAKDDQVALDVPVDTTEFSKNLTVTDNDVQTALETIDQFVFGAGEITTQHNELQAIQGGAAGDYFHLLQADVTKLAGIEAGAKGDQGAVEVPTNVAGFNGNLSGTDVNVQLALDTLDDMTVGDVTPDHNNLNGIQGGALNDYRHLTQNDVTKLAGIEAGAKDDQTAVDVPTDTTSFNNNLSAADTDVQKALDTLDDLSLGGGTSIHNDLTGIQGGAVDDYFHLLQADVTKLAGIEAGAKDDQTAVDVPTDTTSFNNNLSAADTDVQKALDTLDDLSLGGGTSIHNDLTDIQGGAAGDYFHLLQADVTKLAGIETNAKGDQVALDVPTDTASFNNNLSAADTDVQKALDTLDDLSLGGGTSIHNDLTGIQGGATGDYYHLLQADVTKLAGIETNAKGDQVAVEVPVTATGFVGNLSPTDTDVQTALDTIDNLSLGGGGGTSSIGDNLITNGGFGIWQRGESFPAGYGDGYLADRWHKLGGTNDVVEKVIFDPQAGDPMQAATGLNYTRTGAGNAVLSTGIEDGIEMTSGNDVTLSFWVKGTTPATSGRNIAIRQHYDNSNRPQQIFGQITVTTSWVKHEYTVTMPAIDTTLMDVDSRLIMEIDMDGMSSTISFAQMKLEIGASATEYEVPEPVGELARCQRYYVADDSTKAWYMLDTISAVGDWVTDQVAFPVTMRHSAPLFEIVEVTTDVNLQLNSFSQTGSNGGVIGYQGVNISTPTQVTVSGSYTADAEYY